MSSGGYRSPHRRWGGLLATTLAVACSAGDDGASGPLTSGGSDRPASVSAPQPPPPSAAGTGVVVVGGTSSPFDITACALEAQPTEPEGARALVRVEGTGTTATGIGFTVEVQRFATGTDVQTFTDTAVYADSGRILQAQRIEVGGQVTDLRDPGATSALLRLRADGVSLSGLASGPGEDHDDGGLIGLAIDATC